MFAIHTLPQRLSALALALGALLIPLGAQAQDLPSYAQPTNVSTDETIHGRIRSVDGAFNISVDDDRGFVDSVQLHQGTIINPTGLTLSPGMSVTIMGNNAGSMFGANEIDTPYSYSGPLPSPVYLGDGYWYPGFAYGYGPSFSLAILIGGGHGPWSYEHRPFYGRPWNGHGYFGGYVGHAPVAGVRIDVTRSVSDPSRRFPSAFAGRAFAGDSRPPGEYHSPQYRSNDYRSPASPGAYSHGAAPAAGYARDSGGSPHVGGGYERAAPGGYGHGTPGGSEHAGGHPGGESHGAGGGAGHGGGHSH